MTQWLKWTGALALAVAASCLAAGEAHAGLVVVPNNLATVNGGDNNGFPFNIGNSSQRYQQVYSASQFSAFGGPQTITQIGFRPSADRFGNAFSSTLPNIQIDLSTTSKAVNGLSSVFANNVGPDDTVVFSGALALSSQATGPPQGPKDFDILINLTTPFLYDPSKGNLLLDVRNFVGGTTDQFDAKEFPLPNTSSRVWSQGGINSTFGLADSWALVTQFQFGPAAVPSADVGGVPEPGSLALLAVGLAGLVGYGWHRRRQRG
jgi:hypothetical protein